MNKRHFFRRGLAYILDNALLIFAFTLITMILSPATGQNVVGPTFIYSKSCEPSTLRTEEQIRDIFQAADGETTFAFVCTNKRNFIQSVQILSYGVEAEEGNQTRTINFAVDENGERVNFIDITVVFVLIFVFFNAVMLSKFSTTPGKRALGLIVVSEHMPETRATLKHAGIREAVKALPFLIVSSYDFFSQQRLLEMDEQELAALSQTLIEQTQAPQLSDFALPFLSLTIIAIFMFGSFIVWRGQTWWDKGANTAVRSTN